MGFRLFGYLLLGLRVLFAVLLLLLLVGTQELVLWEASLVMVMVIW